MSKKIYNYQVLTSDDLNNLIRQVRRLQDRGYERNPKQGLHFKKYFVPIDWTSPNPIWCTRYWIEMRKELKIK